MDNKYPGAVGLGAVLKSAFYYWNRTLVYQLSYSLLFFSLFFLGYFYLFRYFGLWDALSPYTDLVQTDMAAFNQKAAEVAQLPQTQGFVLGLFILLSLVGPLNVGFYEMYRKIDLDEKVTLNDLFAGYRGFDFFKFFGFYLFWFIVFSYANSLIVLGFVWIMITLFCVPLMYFRNATSFAGIRETFGVLRQDFSTPIIAAVVAILFSLSGLILFGVGFLLTFPFWHAVVFSLYRQYFSFVPEKSSE